MNINEIKIGRFDQKLFDNYKDKLIGKCSENGLQLKDNDFNGVENALKAMANKTDIWGDKLSKWINDVCDELKAFSTKFGDKAVWIVEDSLCKLAKLISSKDTKEMIEKNIKYKELKSKSKLTKIFIIMFKNVIRGSKYKKWKSEFKSLEKGARERMDKCKMGMKKKASNNTELFECFCELCVYMMISMILNAVDCIRGTLVSVDDNSLGFDREIKNSDIKDSENFIELEDTEEAKRIKNCKVTAENINSIDDLFLEENKGKPKYSDIGQIRMNDCYLLSALSSLAKVDPLSIRNCFVKVENGKVTVRFFKVERKFEMKRDRIFRIRFIPKSPVFIEVDLSFLSGSDTRIAPWVKLIEKTYGIYRMKHYDPQYNELPKTIKNEQILEDILGWGNASVALCAITGKPSKSKIYATVNGYSEPENNAFSGNYDEKAEKLWKKINQCLKNRRGVTVMFRGEPRPLDRSKGGAIEENIESIRAQHIYAVLRTFEEKGFRYIELRNPNGEHRKYFKTSFGYKTEQQSKAKEKNPRSVFCVELNHLMEYLQTIDCGK